MVFHGHPSFICNSYFASIRGCSAWGQADGDKDSEAIHYVGKEVEVHGRVVSVTTSPMGTAFTNFGGDYPNQNFAGYIAAGSKVVSRKRLSTLPGKTVSIAGKIELYQGKPEINIIRADQIKVLDSLTERGAIRL